MRTEYKDVPHRRAGRFEGQALEHLSERDSHKIKKRNLGVDNDRAREWRRDTVSGGPTLFKTEFIGNEFGDSEPTRVHKYSYAEVAAGAGGGSRGAEMASFKVVWATESCRHASQTYRANFPNAELHEMEIPKFTGDKTQLVVDLLHIRSAALSVAGDDPKCAQQICTDLLNKTLARFILLDLPASRMSEGNTPFLNAIKLSFTEAGYSINSKIVKMVEYGLPQIRNRFILIGAAPGETLPSWPTATHSPDPTEDQQPFRTEEEVISGLTPELHSLHDPDDMKVMDHVVRDARKPMDTAINGNGSTYHHPDGERDHTPRELASLQGFPTYHQFEGSYIKKQIGNAFPPSVAMAFYQHIRQHMEEFDGVQPGLTESGEPAGDPVTSGLEITTESTIESTVHDDQPNGPLDVVMPVASQDSRSSGDSVRSPFRQQRGAAFSTPTLLMSPASPSPRLTMSPKVESDGRPRSSLSRTPSSAWALPTPSTDGRFVSHKQTADPRLKRGRDQFEEPESDGDDDDSTQALETPSKRPRISGAVHESESASSRTCSTTSDGAAGQAEDVPIPDEADELRGSGPDDEWFSNQARDL